MVSRAPVLGMAAGALLLLLILIPPSVAQVPAIPTDPQAEYFRFVIVCTKTFVQVEFQGAGDAECIARDLTQDSLQPPTGSSFGIIQHVVSLAAVPVGTANETTGWKAYPTVGNLVLTGGMSAPFNVHFTALPTIVSPTFTVDLLANYTPMNSPTQESFNQTVRIVAMVDPYYLGNAQTRINDLSQQAGQNERVTYNIDVTNYGVYPDYYVADVHSADPGFLVAKPPGIYVPPHATRTYTFTVLTPKGSLYEFGRNDNFRVDFTSRFGSSQFSSIGILRVTGPYVPLAWIPMTLVALVSGVVVARRVREGAELRALERGSPRRVQPTPRQAVLLAELKRTDPDAFAERKAALEAVYAQRRGEYKSASKERRARDREEIRQARAEFKAARKKQKADEKARRTQEARERKARKILEAQEAKERKKREKELGKARATLEKKRGKLEKKEAKAAQKQAKIDAKQADADAKAAAKAQKAAQKEAKAAAKAAKRGGDR
jgi:hypothetical protein